MVSVVVDSFQAIKSQFEKRKGLATRCGTTPVWMSTRVFCFKGQGFFYQRNNRHGDTDTMKSENNTDFLPFRKESHTLARKKVEAFGSVIGSYLGINIHEWVIVDGTTYDYMGVASGPQPGIVDLNLLALNEICLTPGLKYRIREKASVQQGVSNPPSIVLEF